MALNVVTQYFLSLPHILRPHRYLVKQMCVYVQRYITVFISLP